MDTTVSLSPHISSESKNAASLKSFWLGLSILVIGFFPLSRLGFLWMSDRLTANPILFVEQQLGLASLDMLVLSLAVTPLVTLTGWRSLSDSRRILGLFAFFYFALHFLAFSVLDYGSDWLEILRLVIEKPFLWIGLVAGSILAALTITSSRYWMKRMGKSWKLLHKSIYLAAGLIILHYAYAVKGSLFTLGGDLVRPLWMSLLIAVLLLFRIPLVKRWISSLRSRFPIFGR